MFNLNFDKDIMYHMQVHIYIMYMYINVHSGSGYWFKL